MQVYIFTEGGSKYGYGHIVRCSSLYNDLKNRGIDVQIIINGDEEVKKVIGDKNYRISNWLSISFLRQILNSGMYAIVDSYLAESEILSFISTNTKKTLFIDDNMRTIYPPGVVVNPSLYSKSLKYPKVSGIKYLLGNEYVILRESFLNSGRDFIRREITEILVTLGGSDIRNLTPEIIKSLMKKYPNLIINVIVGQGFNNIDEIESLKNKNINFLFNLNGEQMREIMLKSDIAISAAGQTIYELMKTETPFIPIQIIDNQENNVNGLLKFDLVNRVLYSDSVNLKDELLLELQFLNRFENRLSLNKKMKGIIDGLGSKRIIDELFV
jgi:UDP-2,4-diacetamido-2,4,6-trideoxy-beta-L-altropyranose hydrolase